MKGTFSASIDHLPDMLKFVVDNAKKLHFSDEALGQIELAAEEALVNVITHGDSPNLDIECPFIDEVRSFKVRIKDSGKPFNPIEKGQGFDPATAIENGAEGGFGIFLMIQMMDTVEYQRIDEHNILTLVKNLPQA